MDHLTSQACNASFSICNGVSLTAQVVKLGPLAVTLEIFHPELVIQSSEVLNEFEIVLAERSIYKGRGVCLGVVNVGAQWTCEVELEHPGIPPDAFGTSRLEDQINGFMGVWHDSYRILPEYKIAVADLRTFLDDLRLWMEQVELTIRSMPAGDRFQREQETLEKIGRPILPVIDRFFETFESLVPKIDPERRPYYQAYLKRHLHPLVLCSPFAYRTFAKPMGYAGDYEMVNMITRNPFEGSSMFAKLVNCWFLEQPPAAAHRNRLLHLKSVILNETARVKALGRAARVLNVACGPAVEILRFMTEHAAADHCHFDLLDFNEETLSQARKAMEECRRRYSRLTTFHFINQPVHQLIKQSSKTVERPVEKQYDLIYCAGLFDYLTDPVCQRLTSLLYSWLTPGGLLTLTNVHPSNPLRYGMEHLLDWHLVYRDKTRFSNLKPMQVKADEVHVSSEMTGVNLFFDVRRNGSV